MVKVYSYSKEEKINQNYEISLNGMNSPCLNARVSAYPINQIWPGYQRPIDQTEICGFTSFSTNSFIDVCVKINYAFEKAIVRPLSKNISTKIVNNCVYFTIPTNGQYVLELDNSHNTLCFFANPMKLYNFKKDQNILYFSEGIHNIGKLSLSSNQILFLEEGAILHTSISINDSENVKIFGYGIIDNSDFERGKGDCLSISNSKNIYIEGITLRDPSGWTLKTQNCENVYINNIKLIGMWRYNSDGVDFCNSTNCILKNSFLRNYDDCVVIKGLFGGHHQNTENILIDNCVTWCDWGRNLEIGAETCAKEIRNIIFKNCDLIHMTHIAMDIQHGDNANVHDVIFEDIRCEFEEINDNPKMQTTKDEVYVNTNPHFLPSLFILQLENGIWSRIHEVGTMSNIKFKDIKVYSKITPPSAFASIDDEHIINNVSLENIIINETKVHSIKEAGILSIINTENVTLL